jgi:hypothetical protein
MKTTIALAISLIYFIDSEINQYHYRQDEKWYEQTILDLTVKLAKSETSMESLKLELEETKVDLVRKDYKPSRTKFDPSKL